MNHPKNRRYKAKSSRRDKEGGGERELVKMSSSRQKQEEKLG